jgi:uncharacterized membrane protein YkoI
VKATFAFLAVASTLMAADTRSAETRPAPARPKISLPAAMELAARAVPGSRVVRLEWEAQSYAVILLAGDSLKAVDIDAATGKAGEVTVAEMDEDEFKDGAAAAKAMAATGLSLAEAVRVAEKKEGGAAVEAELKMVGGKPRYEVKVAKADGSVEVAIDGTTGKPMKPRAAADSGKPFRDRFNVDRANLVSTGRNPYFILEPGYRCHYEGGREKLTITVLNETKLVDGVQTRVVEEREENNGRLAEVSRNFFAIDRTTRDVYYFGEEVDIYRNGKIVNHEGAWLSGVAGAKFGLMMPGEARVGDRFYQEVAPKVAMDRAEIVSLAEPMQTPAKLFERCLYVKESSPLESGTSPKWYAAGIGLVRDDEVRLVKVEAPGKP